uniref:Uncharacterized protein n=1 Tax=Arundo donax TaxID=35708 RepID=A0A0A8ZAF9_ARUDO
MQLGRGSPYMQTMSPYLLDRSRRKFK